MLQAPGDSRIRHSELSGYSPVSRIGEIVTNSFIDVYEHSTLPAVVTRKDIFPETTAVDPNQTYETKPMFHLWATVLPGMITVSRKCRNNVFRSFVAAETAVPCISSAAMLGPDDESSFFFSGVARSKSVVPIDAGEGPTIDEFFTVSLGGQATIINNSGGNIYPGDAVEWAFSVTKEDKRQASTQQYPRRIIVKPATPSSERVFGRSMSFAQVNEQFDVLLRP